ncbi:IS110 family RNA-guided transposase [Actinoallomurus rhizosphaericola]|uniref:IS110 family transposase n=1 Tax=Actinoallomurus rhizosphaericola TaxID=2952536 RepID=UPI002091E96D|nr:IS110 family transposase [Actinoallomurus rhizosphaericola]MCO5998433.1 IS110 family transposase [Actinoallomurus rhizosphaericola]
MHQTAQCGHTDTSDETVVLGVDTHKDAHVAAVITVQGMALGSRSFPTTAAGYQDLLAWARGLGTLKRAGVEGTSSYGIALTRHLHAAGLQVIEVNQPDKAHRRRRGKTDAIDAEAAAQAVLSGRAAAAAKTGDGHVEMVRMFKTAKSSAVKSRAQAINQLKAVLVRADPALRESLTGLSNPRLIRRCADLSPAAPTTASTAADYTLRTLARRILNLTEEINDLNTQITAAITAFCPQLLDCYGVGPDTAAALLIAAGDNPHRLRNQASFAALCGASPIEASSGKTHRHRLNRGGDRQANSALYMIVIARLRWDTRTRAYVAKRQTEGKTRREAIRCLKRYVAREIYQIITRPDPQARTQQAVA